MSTTLGNTSVYPTKKLRRLKQDRNKRFSFVTVFTISERSRCGFVRMGCGVTSLDNLCLTFQDSLIVPNVWLQLPVTQRNITEERRPHHTLV